MLNPLAFLTLADPVQVPEESARLFFRLMADYDLEQFRGLRPGFSLVHIRPLLDIGLLELGTVGSWPKFPGYRIGRRFLLTSDEIRARFLELSAREQRLEISPLAASRSVQ